MLYILTDIKNTVECILLDACEDYLLNKKTAEKILSKVVETMKEWREIAIRQGISKKEIDMFSGVLDERCI